MEVLSDQIACFSVNLILQQTVLGVSTHHSNLTGDPALCTYLSIYLFKSLLSEFFTSCNCYVFRLPF